MVQAVVSLEPEALLAHARAAARSDEERHSADTGGSRPSQHREGTVRGWGGAALQDLEWASHYSYSKVQKAEYRRVYAAEYQRCRTARLLQTDA